MKVAPFGQMFLLAIAVLGTLRPAHAANITWDGSASSDWSDLNNWTPANVPNAAGETPYFDGTGANLPVTFNTTAGTAFDGMLVDSGQTAALSIRNTTNASVNMRTGNGNGITINSGAGAFTLEATGGANSAIQFVLNDAGTYTFTNNSSNVATFSLGSAASSQITLGGSSGATTAAFAGSGDWAMNSRISNGSVGPVSVTKSGNGVLTMSGGNTYAGGTTINEGTLVAGVGDTSTTVGPLGGSSRAVSLGNTSGAVAASLLIDGAFTVGNTITVRTGNSGVMTLGGSTANASTFSGAINLGTSGANPSKDVTLAAFSGGLVNFSGAINESGSNTTVANVTIGDSTHSGTVKLSNVANNYGGITTIGNGATLEATKITTSGSASSIGNSALAATNLVIDNGTLKYTGTGDNTNRLFTIGAGGATLDASGSASTLTFSSTSALAYTGTSARTFTLTGTNTNANAFAPLIADNTGATSLTKSGVGSWTLTNANTYSGGTTISDGTLGAANNSALGSSSSTVAVNSGALRVDASGGQRSIAQTITGGGTAEFIGANRGLVTGTITGFTGDFHILNTGVFAAWNATATAPIASNTQAITIDSTGALQILAVGGIPTTSFGALNGSGTINTNSGLTNSAKLSIGNGGGNGAFSGVISDSNLSTGTLAVIKNGAGTQILSGANTYAGGTTINDGILQAGSATAFGTATAASIAFGASSTGKVQLFGNSMTVIGLTTNATVGTPILESGSGTAGTDTLTVNNAGANTFAGVLQNGSTRALALTKGAAGTLTLSGTNTYTGDTTIGAGTLSITNANALGSGSSAVKFTGGTLNVNLATATIGNTLSVATGQAGTLDVTNTGAGISTGAIAIDGDLTLRRSSGGNTQTTIASAITGSGTLFIGNVQGGTTVGGSQGRARFENNNFTSFTGDIHVLGTNGGGNFAFPQGLTNQQVTVDSGGYFSLITGTISIGGLNGAGVVTRNTSPSTTATLSVGNGNATGSFSGIISETALGADGTVALTKNGSGTQTLSGASSYTGGTTITSGLLLANNTTGSATGTGAVVVNGGTFGGTGSITGGVTVNTNGTLAPGASIESLGMGVLSMLGTSTFALEINTSAITTDLANVTGNFSLAAGNSVQLTIADLGSNVALTAGTTFVFVDYSGTWNNGLFNLNGSNVLSDDEVFAFGANSYRISYNGVTNSTTDVVLQVVAVPEPSSLAMLLFGSVMLWVVRRKRTV